MSDTLKYYEEQEKILEPKEIKLSTKQQVIIDLYKTLEINEKADILKIFRDNIL